MPLYYPEVIPIRPVDPLAPMPEGWGPPPTTLTILWQIPRPPLAPRRTALFIDAILGASDRFCPLYALTQL